MLALFKLVYLVTSNFSTHFQNALIQEVPITYIVITLVPGLGLGCETNFRGSFRRSSFSAFCKIFRNDSNHNMTAFTSKTPGIPNI